ncbi:hypothetical protein Tco_0992029 [Tanacetum coccineum]|uniref:Integrase, catalytic region, zinc finger, CCHC-type, peptidase aspartic, catalytic n=1 Tax=Tanacetum coccineum TaxID=301880 RepID=A0ABQ5F152_9ASTR
MGLCKDSPGREHALGVAGAADIGELRTRVGNENPGPSKDRLSASQTTATTDVDEQPVHDLALNVDNVFQADDCDAFDSDIDEAPAAQTMFIGKISSSAYPVYDRSS